MPTSKKRINISVSKEMDEVLAKLAKRDQVPQATKAEHLIRIALELEEDRAVSSLADERDIIGTKFLSHDEVWG